MSINGPKRVKCGKMWFGQAPTCVFGGLGGSGGGCFLREGGDFPSLLQLYVELRRTLGFGVSDQAAVTVKVKIQMSIPTLLKTRIVKFRPQASSDLNLRSGGAYIRSPYHGYSHWPTWVHSCLPSIFLASPYLHSRQRTRAAGPSPP